jgi:acyl-CoA synthetase (AMP-forming)/AMP-acid ligase II
MANWLNLGEIFSVNAAKFPKNIAFMDATRSFTFPEANKRINRLAHALTELGFKKGDKFSCLLENSVEICELYIAAAKIGVIINPINFRVSADDVVFIAGNADSKAMFVHDQFTGVVDSIRKKLPKVKNWFVIGEAVDGYESYEQFIEGKSEKEPEIRVAPSDTWILLYTSGTTGKPKGVMRSHESYIAFYLINGGDFKYSYRDMVLTAMPLCHVNTTYFSFASTYFGGGNYIHPAMGFDAEKILDIIAKCKATFISLIPTHYSLILAIPKETRAKYNVSSIKKLLCSSAPARLEHKKGILEYFEGVELYEGYGSTEAGIVTTLMPEDQMTHPGSIGKESSGTDVIKILNADGNEVAIGEVGELYSRGPMMFDEYYKMPDVTKTAFVGEYFSAGDMAKRDSEGYYFLVDRKKNMIITGGEHVFPSQVENVISEYPAVMEVAVIGVPHDKWTEMVMAVIVLKEGETATEEDIKEHCKKALASFKCPKKIEFVAWEDIPRNGTGKVLHRLLRDRYSK